MSHPHQLAPVPRPNSDDPLDRSDAGVTAPADLGARVAWITAACNRRLGAKLGPAEVDDVRQEVLLALWSRSTRTAASPATDGWIYGAVRIQIQNHLRRTHRRREEPFGRDFLEPAGREPEPGSSVGTDLRLRVGAVLGTLGTTTQVIVRERFLEGRSFKTVALRLCASEGSLRARWLRRLPSLRERLKGVWATLGE